MMESQNRIPGILTGRIGDLSQRIKVLEEMLGRLKTLDMNAHELQYIIYSYAEMIKEGLVLIQDEKVIWANKAACHMLGYELEEVVNKSAVELSHPRVRQQLSARFAMVQAGDEIPAGVMWPLITKTREVKLVKPFSYRVIYKGRPAIMAFYYDVTEEKKIQEELAMRAGLLELVSDFIFMLDAKGNIKYVNKAMCEALGYTQDEMLGRPILDFHTKAHRERVKIRLKLMTPMSHGIYKTEYVCKDGTLISVSARGKVTNIDGTDHILAVARPLDHHDASI
jgi:two-component system cell cycle sensor histidine kinase/response regulator CckA